MSKTIGENGMQEMHHMSDVSKGSSDPMLVLYHKHEVKSPKHAPMH